MYFNFQHLMQVDASQLTFAAKDLMDVLTYKYYDMQRFLDGTYIAWMSCKGAA